MVSSLQRLIGQQLLRCDQGAHEFSLEFSAGRVVVFNPITSSNPFQCVGSTVVSLVYVEKECCRLTFANGRDLSVSLVEDDYVGPEAFVATFPDGGIVVAP